MEGIKLDLNKADIRRRRPIVSNALRYGTIVICTDADTDGYSICAQLINFFYKYWPELVQHNKINICNTPILQAKYGKNTLDFYSIEEYKQWEKQENNLSKWKVAYKKGLAALDDKSYKKILHEPNITIIDEDYISEKTLIEWFHKDKEYRTKRKEKIK
jgi:DNA gyrase/topoisomerase IV subunit B